MRMLFNIIIVLKSAYMICCQKKNHLQVHYKEIDAWRTVFPQHYILSNNSFCFLNVSYHTQALSCSF